MCVPRAGSQGPEHACSACCPARQWANRMVLTLSCWPGQSSRSIVLGGRLHRQRDPASCCRRAWACMLRPTLSALLGVTALVWCCTYLINPPALLSRLTAADRQQVLLQDSTVDVQNLWQYQLASFQLPHPLLPLDSIAVDTTRWNAAYIRAVAAAAPAKHHAECKTLQALSHHHVRSIAVVGNGPLSTLQRQQIHASDVVMRFNELNTRECGERLDVWIVRFAWKRPLHYHGLTRTKGCNVSDAMLAARSVWFMNGEAEHERDAVKGALLNLTHLQERLWVPLHTQHLYDFYRAHVSDKGIPSSGWLGTQLAVACAPAGAKVHVFGFNWSRKHWKAHPMEAEEAHAKTLHESGRVFIHWPVCDGLRTCDLVLVDDDREHMVADKDLDLAAERGLLPGHSAASEDPVAAWGGMSVKIEWGPVQRWA